MKQSLSIASLVIVLSGPALSSDGSPQTTPTPAPVGALDPVAHAQQATIGDTAGGRYIPKPILDILADPHFDPNVAYLLWQLSRKPIGDWTLAEFAFVAQITPTMLETNTPLAKIQTLYQFWGLDPSDIFNASLGANWQSHSTAFSTANESSVIAISTAECQLDLSEQTVSTFEACTSGRIP